MSMEKGTKMLGSIKDMSRDDLLTMLANKTRTYIDLRIQQRANEIIATPEEENSLKNDIRVLQEILYPPINKGETV